LSFCYWAPIYTYLLRVDAATLSAGSHAGFLQMVVRQSLLELGEPLSRAVSVLAAFVASAFPRECAPLDSRQKRRLAPHALGLTQSACGIGSRDIASRVVADDEAFDRAWGERAAAAVVLERFSRSNIVTREGK
jgi:hypothetical protein